mmetsp:Transcript_96561/g.211154  ORF Transcript_96561/g.211154 Transcript_96561/m.211154 type:complete len:89 (+) Transcript_96561:66-332(+)
MCERSATTCDTRETQPEISLDPADHERASACTNACPQALLDLHFQSNSNAEAIDCRTTTASHAILHLQFALRRPAMQAGGKRPLSRKG